MNRGQRGQRAWIGGVVLMISTLAACNGHPLKSVELDGEQEKDGTVAVSVNRDVDILFVIDNSRSMAQEQATLARNFGPLIERLERDDVRANYRIAITTTDNGHMHCPGRDAGNFKASSCLGRREDFQITSHGEVVEDYFAVACSDRCAHEDIEILPTTTFHDPTPRPRPWIESIGGVTNLPEGISPVDAFECLAPQGVTGCGFEAPLESMRLGLLQANDTSSEEYGFMRPGAILAVVFVTDEADCSARWSEVPDPWDVSGSRALWSPENAEAGRITSEVCWFGGVECEDSPDGSRECWAADKAADGSVTDDPAQAVLHPLARYEQLLAEIEASKQELDPEQQVLVAVLTGVPTDYDGGRIPYGDGNDPEYLRDTGVGAGCESANGKAAPPVRLAELADAFATSEDDVNLYSVCKEDYSDAMSSIAEAIGRQVRPPCVETCVADTDPTREGVQHNCQLLEEHVTANGEAVEVDIPACEHTDAGVRVPDGVDACYRALTDADGTTAAAGDDMSRECVDEGWNLELAIERREGTIAPAGASVRARCSVSRQRAVDCPGLGA
jgi:hypothetical protein